MEERRRLGLCFNCNERFGRGHNRVCQRLFLIDVADEEGDDAEHTETPTDEPIISVLAASGVRTRETISCGSPLAARPASRSLTSAPATTSSPRRPPPERTSPCFHNASCW
jgi:hypothetical protein